MIDTTIPSTLYNALRSSNYDKVGKYSVTTLISSPQIRQLYNRYGHLIEDDPDENIYSLLGSAMHAVLEEHVAPHQVSEKRMIARVAGVEISGKPDLYDPEEECLYDYKVTSTWVARKGEPKPEWVKQMNCYCWFLRHAGYTPKRAKIVAIFRDWSKMKQYEYQDYPNKPYMVFPIPLWAPEEVDAYIRERIAAHEEAEALPDDELPQCSDEDRWMQKDKYAVTRYGYTKAYKVFDNKQDAENFLAGMKSSVNYYIDHRPGVPLKCEQFCAVREFCQQYAKWKQQAQEEEEEE